ncbi:unnamed protein product [Rotaria magnacalcarata]|uniref:Vacuolar protein sorting-associated protein 28 homolog n=1 Tax=Rotaria magnacalcarata TaxID=392030 RepID=A0A8S2RG98_9BILA|nr:unnamed protein product [Rotaria magnacalcarata]CAF4117296.1 unnamed protein product [Rotaria magnacalcarata]CAF4149540.1 unnamed protein product [Rotaria magnacalcarata]
MGSIRSPPSENGCNGETSEVRRNIQDDWQRRDDILLLTTAIKRLVDFLNQFESSCRFRLSTLNEKLTALERHVDYLEAREVRLWKNPRERERYDNMADVFSIITTLQALEKAYIKDLVEPAEYTSNCQILLAKYSAAFRQLEGEFPKVEDFVHKYKLDCPAAILRINEGRPITVRDDRGNMGKSIAETVSLFINLMDKLKLNIRANDMLQTDVRDLLDVINRMNLIPSNYTGRDKIPKWLNILTNLNAAEEITDDQARQFQMDLEICYNEFNRLLSAG